LKDEVVGYFGVGKSDIMFQKMVAAMGAMGLATLLLWIESLSDVKKSNGV